MNNTERPIYSEEINLKILQYYKKYYKTTLGLPDWENLSKKRLNEEEIYCSRYIETIKELIDINFIGKNILVVGSGTGGELINFHIEGANVYGIEPFASALEISRLKVKSVGIPEENIKSCKAEDMDFEDSYFDFVYCYTVIEHVDDVSKSIQEMLRVTKPNGLIFLQAPDYRQMYEGHYKLPLPMFLPLWLNKIILILLGRPSNFLNSINRVTSKSIKNILTNHPVTSLAIHTQKEKRFSDRFILKIIFSIQDLISKIFDAPFNQVWLIKKNK